MKLVFAILLTLAGYIDYVAAPCFRQQETAWCSPDSWSLAPYRFRVLVPVLEYLFIPHAQYVPDEKGLTPFGNAMPAVLAAISVQAIFLALFLTFLVIWLKRCVGQHASDVGLFITVTIVLISYHRFQFALDTTVEAAGVTAACLLLSYFPSKKSTI